MVAASSGCCFLDIRRCQLPGYYFCFSFRLFIVEDSLRELYPVNDRNLRFWNLARTTLAPALPMAVGGGVVALFVACYFMYEALKDGFLTGMATSNYQYFSGSIGILAFVVLFWERPVVGTEHGVLIKE